MVSSQGCIDSIVPNSHRTIRTVASADSTFRSQPTTDAPSRANAKAAARPMLPPVPVMIHTLPESLRDTYARSLALTACFSASLTPTLTPSLVTSAKYSISTSALFLYVQTPRSLFIVSLLACRSAARLHVLARPLGKGGESAGNEGIRCGDAGLSVRTEIGVRLEVLEHLAQLLGAGEEAVIDLRRDPYDPEVVSERIERRHEIVPRVHAAAHGEVATVRQPGSGAERCSHGSAELADVPGVDDARRGIHRDRPTATTVRQGLRCEQLQILEVERRLDKRVALEARRPDYGIHVCLHGEVLHLQAPAAYLLRVGQRGPDQMLHPSGAGGVDGAGADLLLAPALSGVPEIGHQEGPAGSVVEGLQARCIEQVGLHDLDAARCQRLCCTAGRVATCHPDLEFPRSE